MQPLGLALPGAAPAGGLAQSPERVPSPISHTRYTFLLPKPLTHRRPQSPETLAHCSREGPLCQNPSDGMEISQGQTTRPRPQHPSSPGSCSCPLPPLPVSALGLAGILGARSELVRGLARMCVCMCTCMFVCQGMCAHICVCVHVCKFMSVCIPVCMFVSLGG